MIDQVIIQSTADTSQAEQEYVGLRKEIKNLKAELDLLDEGTAEYDATFTKLSNKMKQQQDRTKALRSSSADLGDVFSNTSKVIGGVAQGFAGATAALSLFGVENEQLLKTIQKVQAFEAIGRSFTGLEETITKTLPALKNNIMAFFKDTSKMKINVGVDAGVTGNVQQGVAQQAVQTIDSEAFEKAAKSSKDVATSQQAAAGAMLTSAGGSRAQLEAEKEITANKLQQLQDEMKINLNKLNTIQSERAANIKANKELSDELNKSANNISNKIVEINSELTGTVINQETLDELHIKQDAALEDAIEKHKKIYEKKTKLNELIEIQNKEYEEGVNKVKKQEDQIKDTEKAQQTLNKTTTGFGKIWGQFKNIAAGVGIGLAIAAVTAGITYLVKLYQKQKEQLKGTLDFHKQIGDEVGKNLANEQATLAVLNFNYSKIKGDIKDRNKYLKDNEKQYKKVGVEVDKIIKGEISYSDAIKESNKLLEKRALNMAYFSQLTKEYETKISLETSIGTLGEDIIKGSIAYDDVSKELQNYYKQIAESDKKIDYLRRKITELPKDDTKTGGAAATTIVKSYNELIQETLNLYQGLNLNNPFTPERIRQIESQFENVKTIADRTVFEIANNEALSDEEKLRRISDVNQTIIAAERTKILALKQISLDNAKWERDNQLRALKEQAAIQKNNYKQTIEDAKKSLEKGSISQSKFDEIFNKVQVAAGTAFKSVKEFYKYLGGNEVVNRNDKFINGVSDVANSFKTVTDGVESFDSEGFKKKIKDLYNVDLDVTNPLDVDLGKLSVDEFNFLQQLIKQYQDYNNTVQGIQIQANADTKANTEKNYAEQLNLINKQFAEIESEYDKYQSRLRTQINDNSNISFMDFITGNKSGYQNREDVIKGLEADIELENQRQESIKKTIQTKQDELLNQNITLEERAKINEELKQLDVDLTSSEETESEKRLSIAEKEKEKRKEIFDATVQGLEDVTTIMSNIYEANETNELNNLKRLLKSKAITQEQYEERSEALANEYAKKRQRIEIFQGLLAATSSSIGAFSSAMRPDSGIPYPYNLIAAGISSAAAFSAVIAQVATLRGLSVGDTSSTPVQSTAGTGLNYTLQEQQVSNERLLNSLTNQRVYVLESDITSTQARVSEVQAMSIF